MTPAGYILTGQRRNKHQAHPPIILTGHIDELTQDFTVPTDLLGQLYSADREAAYPDFHNFNRWPVTRAVLDTLAESAHLPGHNSLAEFSAWRDPATRRVIICTADELAAA